MPEKAKPPVAPETLRLPPLGSEGFIPRIEVAKYLYVSVQQIDRWVETGWLYPHKVGRKIIFCKAEVNWRLAKGFLPAVPRPPEKSKEEKAEAKKKKRDAALEEARKKNEVRP